MANLCRNSSTVLLLAVIILQWFLLTYVIYYRQEKSGQDLHLPSKMMKESSKKLMLSTHEDVVIGSHVDEEKRQQQKEQRYNSGDFNGVAVTLALRAPKWFHRRYTSMLYNVFNNIPDDWAVQLVIHPQWWESEILKLHRGMPKLLDQYKSRLILTELPSRFWRYKPKQIMVHRWFWDQVVAERVLVFTGNGVLCPHSVVNVHHFDAMDFVGAPAHGGRAGGDGSTHSLRSRKAMMEAIEYANKPGDFLPPGTESMFFISTLESMNKNGGSGKHGYLLAPANETVLFGGGAELITTKDDNGQTVVRSDMELYGPSFVLSGTGANLDFDVRDALLQICPEWKLIFPSLHDPNCFGASPKADQCAASICALKPDRPKQGC